MLLYDILCMHWFSFCYYNEVPEANYYMEKRGVFLTQGSGGERSRDLIW